MTVQQAQTMIDYDQLFIGSGWNNPKSDSRIHVISPVTEQIIGSVPEASPADVDNAVAAARRAFDDPQGWSTWEPHQRTQVLERFAAVLDSQAEERAQRVTMQNGMPISLARQFESVFPPALIRFYAGMMESAPSEESRPGLFGGSTIVSRKPVGVVAAIVPWNVPQSLTFLKLAPALAAGCSMVLKPSPETVLDAFLMAEAASAAGLPEGILNLVPGGREIGEYLVSHPGIDKVGFTGSTAAGRSIAATCGRLLRPVTLELGGKSAAIVLDDADLESNAERFFAATLSNNGQICWLGTRILAPASRYDEVVDFVTGMAASLTVADPALETTQVGPLVSKRQLERVSGYVEQGRTMGAKLTTGGGQPKGLNRGWFLEPTVFADVDQNATLAQEEIFGPVLSIIRYHDDDEAVAIANNSEYGLAGSVWTADPERGEDVARRVATGSIGINSYINDLNAPLSGIKNSGLGGAEMGPEGLQVYQEVKSIYREISAG